jgi:hypothetical protein
MMEDDITFVCPCCLSTLGIDDSGEPIVVEEAPLPQGTFHNGNRSIRVEDADGGEYRRLEYLRNQGNQNLTNALKPLTSFTKLVEGLEPVVEEKPEPIDPKLLEASQKDLNQKGIY